MYRQTLFIWWWVNVCVALSKTRLWQTTDGGRDCNVITVDFIHVQISSTLVSKRNRLIVSLGLPSCIIGLFTGFFSFHYLYQGVLWSVVFVGHYIGGRDVYAMYAMAHPLLQEGMRGGVFVGLFCSALSNLALLPYCRIDHFKLQNAEKYAISTLIFLLGGHNPRTPILRMGSTNGPPNISLAQRPICNVM